MKTGGRQPDSKNEKVSRNMATSLNVPGHRRAESGSRRWQIAQSGHACRCRRAHVGFPRSLPLPHRELTVAGSDLAPLPSLIDDTPVF